MRERSELLEPFLFVHVPSARKVPRRHPACIGLATQLVRTFVAIGAVHHVATAVGVSGVAVECHRAPVGIHQLVVVVAFFDRFFEILIGVEGRFAAFVLQSPALKARARAVDVRRFHAAEEVHRVAIVERAAVVGRGTEVVVAHPVVCLVHDAAFREHRVRQFSGIVRIVIEELVGVADDAVGHGAIGQSLVRIVLDVVLLRRGRVLEGAQGRKFEPADGLVFQFELEFGVQYTEVNVVVFQLIEDVERRIVGHIVGLGVEHTRGVHRIRIGVDVEIAFHRAVHHVDVLAQRTGGALIAIGSPTDHVECEVVENVVGEIEVHRVALHVTLLVPTRIEQGAERSIVVRFGRTSAQAHRMVLHDGRREEFFEPIGVAKFCLLQVGVFRLGGVRQQELAARGVEGIFQLIHLAVHAVVATIQHIRVVEPAFVAQFAIDPHLLLRVENVEIAIRGHQTRGELARVVEMSLPLAALFGGHHDHARHGARTVDRRGRTVLEHLEALDVVGVQARDGRTDERFGVTRCEVVGADVRHIFHDHAVHHPKGLRSAVDRRGTAHTNLRGGTECAAHVLHRHAGCLSFERAADVGHARQARFADVDLVGGPREEAAVGLRHTRGHHHLAEALVVFEHDAHVFRTFQRDGLHSDVRHGDARVFSLDGQGEITVVVGHGELFATDRGDVCPGDRLIVRARDHNARHFGLRQRGGDTKYQTQQEGGQFFLHRSC